jgi:hypothetical protein
MAIGEGKYDTLCTYVREQAEAEGAIVVIMRGKDGSGFAVQADLQTQLTLPDILEFMARQIRADLEKGKL